METPIGTKYRANFQQTMLRIKDPKVSVPFYEQNFGMKLIHRYDFPEFKFSLYFLERPREGQALPKTVPSLESEQYLWTMQGCCLELTHNYGSESDPDFKVWSGNHGRDLPESSPLYMKDGPIRGFGHIAFNVDDVYATCDVLEKAGVKFQKKPDDGRMKGLAFALDPDGYWIEIVKRAETGVFSEPFNLSQTMKRVKDAAATRHFYEKIMGLQLVYEMTIPNDFTNYFFVCLSDEEKKNAPTDVTDREQAKPFVGRLWQPVLEITHNHGTEKDEAFQVHTGNSDPQGFGHIGFIVDDLVSMCKEMEAAGVKFFKKPEEGKIQGIAFALDPDGYRVELIQRGATIPMGMPTVG
mmetsp:Transcript_36764/g.80623  ORF Transcript_36764/g.80623 Transcript_36764/m.80623 type:complete len:353 (-) Transcript_36764:122-1180(-)